jgi:hypothetical protein
MYCTFDLVIWLMDTTKKSADRKDKKTRADEAKQIDQSPSMERWRSIRQAHAISQRHFVSPVKQNLINSPVVNEEKTQGNIGKSILESCWA